MPTDHELLDAWRAGDKQAGIILFQQHFMAVYRFLARKVTGEVDDLVQQSFLAMAEARVRLREGSSFRGYLFACVRNVLHEHLRQCYRGAGELDPSTTSLEDLGASPGWLLAKRHEYRLLLSALRRIPLDEQLAVELYYWEGLSGREVADVLGVPEGTIRTRLRGARAKLAERMAELEGDAALVASTLDGLERWAEDMRKQLEPG